MIHHEEECCSPCIKKSQAGAVRKAFPLRAGYPLLARWAAITSAGASAFWPTGRAWCGTVSPAFFSGSDLWCLIQPSTWSSTGSETDGPPRIRATKRRLLTERAKAQPVLVILLDEIEKARPDIYKHPAAGFAS
jgi:hypothetical protein